MNPHSPIEPEGIFDGLRGGAILFGALADIAATVVASTLILTLFVPELFSADEAAARAALAELQTDTAFVAASVAIGALGTVLGAFLGARRAGRLHVRHGGWIAVASTVIGTALSLLDPGAADPASAPPLWAQVTSWLLILPAGIAGGALAGWRQGGFRR